MRKHNGRPIEHFIENTDWCFSREYQPKNNRNKQQQNCTEARVLPFSCYRLKNLICSVNHDARNTQKEQVIYFIKKGPNRRNWNYDCTHWYLLNIILIKSRTPTYKFCRTALSKSLKRRPQRKATHLCPRNTRKGEYGQLAVPIVLLLSEERRR